MIIVEVTCQDYNGGCDQVCNETETGVKCSCYDGYQLMNAQNCTGKWTSVGTRGGGYSPPKVLLYIKQHTVSQH